MKKLLSLLLAIVVLFSTAAPFSACAEDALYDSDTAYTETSVSKTYNGKTYYSKGDALYRLVKEQLVRRNTHLTLSVLRKEGAAQNGEDLLLDLYLGATFDGISETATDGDYALWAVEDYKALSLKTDTVSDGWEYLTLTAQFSYYDTDAEEKKTDNEISLFLASLDTNGKTDAEILKALHDTLCERNVYDTAAARNPSKYPYALTAFGAMLKGKAICQGYAVAFYRLCRELGYGARFVSSDPSFGCHAWNLVALDGKYYAVDVMWNDRRGDGAATDYPKDYYFLTDCESVKEYDSYLGEHTLYSALYENNYFNANYQAHFASVPYTKESGKRLSACRITLSDTVFAYAGKAVTPLVAVKDGNTVLKQGTDYTLTYSNNNALGLGRVDITGIGAYAGTKTHRLFAITPAKPAKPKAAAGVTAVKLSWNAVKGASGYAVQQYKNGAWQTVALTAKTACTVKGLKPATKYSLRICSYKTVGRRKVFSKAGSKRTVATKPKKAALKTLKAGRKKLTVKWKKTAGTGYQLQYATNKSFNNAKSIKVKSGTLSKTLKKLKTGKRYYIRVRAFRTYKNESGKTKTIYGKWSAKKSVKVK